MAAERGWKEGGSCSFPRTRHPNEQEDQESQLLIRVTILQEQTLQFISSVRGVGQTPTDGALLAATRCLCQLENGDTERLLTGQVAHPQPPPRPLMLGSVLAQTLQARSSLSSPFGGDRAGSDRSLLYHRRQWRWDTGHVSPRRKKSPMAYSPTED